MDATVSNNVPWHATLTIADGPPLFGATLHMQLRAQAASSIVALDLSTANGRLKLADLDNRLAALHVDGPTMLAVPAGSYVFDLVVTPASGDPFVGATGTVTVTQGITLG